MSHPIRTIAERFTDYITRADKTSGCWIWPSTLDAYGYGMFPVRVPGRRKYKCTKAHRIAWLVTHGDPGDKCVLHRCDVRACVNPEHLFLGTNADNNYDAKNKGRNQKQLGHWNVKLTPEAVAEIRMAVTNGEAQRAIGRRYGVAQSTISKIALNYRWR